MNSENINIENMNIKTMTNDNPANDIPANDNKNNTTSDWTIEDCETYVNTLYRNHLSCFRERKASALFRSHTRHIRKTTINNDGIYVNGKIFLSPAHIKKCVSVGNLYFFEQKSSILIKCVKADVENSTYFL